MSSHVLPGYIDTEGRITARPVIVEIDDSGRVISHKLLTGWEPPFTTPLPHLLDLRTNCLIS